MNYRLFKIALLAPLLAICTQCTTPGPMPAPLAGGYTPSGSGMQQIINVSAYDPKQPTRSGQGYSVNDVSPLKANGAVGLIARAGKGGVLDEKCASFLAAADRIGMMPGVYYRVQRHMDAGAQAEQFVARVQSLARSRPWNAPALLLCGDYDGDLPLSSIVKFMDRVEARTGVVPVAYLENSQQLKLQTRAADGYTKAKLSRAPYWLALYSHTSGAGPVFPAPGSPEGLVAQYGLWPNWTLWQYGGVDWGNNRPQAKVYNNGRYRFNSYFGNLDRPVERNVFRGSLGSLQGFWQQHGYRLR